MLRNLSQVASLKDDITALSRAQKTAREATTQLEEELSKERAEKGFLADKMKVSGMAMICCVESFCKGICNCSPESLSIPLISVLELPCTHQANAIAVC